MRKPGLLSVHRICVSLLLHSASYMQTWFKVAGNGDGSLEGLRGHARPAQTNPRLRGAARPWHNARRVRFLAGPSQAQGKGRMRDGQTGRREMARGLGDVLGMSWEFLGNVLGMSWDGHGSSDLWTVTTHKRAWAFQRIIQESSKSHPRVAQESPRPADTAKTSPNNKRSPQQRRSAWAPRLIWSRFAFLFVAAPCREATPSPGPKTSQAQTLLQRNRQASQERRIKWRRYPVLRGTRCPRPTMLAAVFKYCKPKPAPLSAEPDHLSSPLTPRRVEAAD